MPGATSMRNIARWFPQSGVASRQDRGKSRTDPRFCSGRRRFFIARSSAYVRSPSLARASNPRALHDRLRIQSSRQVPKACPQSPSSRVAQNASATAGDEIPHQQARLQRERHHLDNPPGDRLQPHRVGQPAVQRRGVGVQPRIAAACSPTSSRKISTVSGSRCMARNTSRQMTLPVPSQMPFNGASRYSRSIR